MPSLTRISYPPNPRRGGALIAGASMSSDEQSKVQQQQRSRLSVLKASEPEFANACLVEAEVVTNLVTHRLGDVCPEAVGIVPEVAYKRVAKDQDLVWQATAPEERGTTQLGAYVHAVRVVLGTAVGNHYRYVLQRSLELDRELVER
jgi:hypothetical protein